MLRQTRVMAAAEFKQKSRWSKVWPNMRYGAMYLHYSVGRQLPMRGVNWVTRDSNRLTRFEDRYATVIADLDVKKNEEELNIPLSDVRWNDHRRLHWVCAFCGASYKKNVSVRTKYHAGCNACKNRFASEVLREQATSESLKSKFPHLAAQLIDNGKQENIASLSCTSKYNATWKCSDCGEAYKATIRSRTGVVEAGQSPLHPQTVSWSSFCPSCRWGRNLAAAGEQALKEGQMLGLDLSATTRGGEKWEEGKGAVPRRKRLVV